MRPAPPAGGPVPPRRGGTKTAEARRENGAGWLFVAPAITLIGLFLVVPAGLAFYVSMLDWNGTYSPLTGRAPFVGWDNYRQLLFEDGLVRRDFMTSVRNTTYFVLLVVPSQTLVALALAVVVNNRALRGRAFFRSVFYFPSITSSVAISVIFLFLFSGSGAVNALLEFFGVQGPNWFTDSRGVLHEVLALFGLDGPPRLLAETELGGLSLWEWVSGPSVALVTVIALVVWTTSGTYMLIFLAALQNLPENVSEAALVDGAGWWQKFWKVTVPQLMPTIFLVATLGLIGTWQVFDQVYVMSQGAPAKTTLTPAFLSYQQSFAEGSFGVGAAIALLLFLLIVGLTALQRVLLRDGRNT
ncbi:sugar ABC transporter permease [Saccharopolyspora rhizosphaerae]|uniref:Sugar ABC transporter permease n=1 Tax=Saccharopolyspora rhizosphaerae TaxID=2492662 RepID=A0A426K030_9PSEU|nr:sugar ABC transporter permease [Saccharopolyspora rhizosphaerae]